MTLDDVLGEIINGLVSPDAPYIVNWNTLQHWPDEALDILVKNRLLVAAKQAESIECPQCIEHCYVDVHIITHDERPPRAFVVCEDEEMQGQMGAIPIPLEQVQQWRVTVLQLAKRVAELLAIKNKIEQKSNEEHIRIGPIKGKHGRKWLVMALAPLALEINGTSIPLDEALYFDDDRLRIDRDKIQYCADTLPKQQGSSYSPSTTKQEARKLNTAARDEDIRQAYIDLRKQHPRSSLHTDQWVANHISKMEIAQGCSAERIIRIMKSNS